MTLDYFHEQPCGCAMCEGTRSRAYRGPGLYKAIAAHRDPTFSGTTTWTLSRFEWGERIKPGALVWVERPVLKDEPGYHLKGLVIWVLDGASGRFDTKSTLCTSANWLEPA